MIYHLQTGMQREFKRFLVPIVVLIITAGFPAMASFVTREDLTLSPWPIVSNDEPGVVLGDNTGSSNGSSSSSSDNPGTTNESTEPGTAPSMTESSQTKKSQVTNPDTTPLPSAPTTPEGGSGGSDPSTEPLLPALPGLPTLPCGECDCICPLIP